MLGVSPSYATGFAQWPGESEFPQLWGGLMGAWDMSLGITGNKLFDLSGNGQHSTSWTGDPTWISGKSGSAINFDGNDSIDKTNFPFITPPLTIVVWINQASGVGTKYYGICCRGKRTVSGTNFDFAIRRQTANGRLSFYWRDVDTLYGGEESSDFDYGVAGWTQVAGVIDSAFDLTLYRDAVVIGTNTSNATPTSGITTFHIGDSEGGDPFIGDIDHIMIYNRALSAGELTLLYCLRKRYAA